MNLPMTAGTASGVVFLAASVWGLYWIPLRYLEQQGIGGMFAVALLCLPAMLLLSIYMLKRWRDYQHLLKLILVIGICTGIGVSLYSSGVIYSSVVRATLLFYMTPVWATLIEIFVFRQPADRTRWLAIVGGLMGMSLLLSGHSQIPLNIGDFLAFLSGIFWAVGMAMVRQYNHLPVAGLALGQLTFTAIGALLIGALLGDHFIMPSAQDSSLWLMVTLVSVFGILGVILAIFWGQKSIDPGRAGLLCMSEVIVAVLSATILLPEERMSALQWSGAILILSACLFEVLGSHVLKPKPVPINTPD